MLSFANLHAHIHIHAYACMCVYIFIHTHVRVSWGYLYDSVNTSMVSCKKLYVYVFKTNVNILCADVGRSDCVCVCMCVCVCVCKTCIHMFLWNLCIYIRLPDWCHDIAMFMSTSCTLLNVTKFGYYNGQIFLNKRCRFVTFIISTETVLCIINGRMFCCRASSHILLETLSTCLPRDPCHISPANSRHFSSIAAKRPSACKAHSVFFFTMIAIFQYISSQSLLNLSRFCHMQNIRYIPYTHF